MRLWQKKQPDNRVIVRAPISSILKAPTSSYETAKVGWDHFRIFLHPALTVLYTGVDIQVLRDDKLSGIYYEIDIPGDRDLNIAFVGLFTHWAIGRSRLILDGHTVLFPSTVRIGFAGLPLEDRIALTEIMQDKFPMTMVQVVSDTRFSVVLTDPNDRVQDRDSLYSVDYELFEKSAKLFLLLYVKYLKE